MIITIAGAPGSGKSTVAKLLAERLGYEYISVGNVRRKMAEERGMTLEAFNKLGETEEFTDREVDVYQKKLGETKDKLVIEGRTGWYFIPNSYKIFLDVDLKTAAERIFEDIKNEKRPQEKGFATLDEVVESLKKRMKSDSFRYKRYYGQHCDYLNKKNYDLVVDTTKKNPKEIVDYIVKNIK